MQTIQLEPYQRIKRAGCDVNVKYYVVEPGVIRLRVLLMRDGVLQATASVAKNGMRSKAETLERIRAGQWGPSSEMHKALMALADYAEKLNSAEVA